MKTLRFYVVLVGFLPVVAMSDAALTLPEPKATMAQLGLPDDAVSNDTILPDGSSSDTGSSVNSAAKYLSLNDAILLALRNNPNVISAQLERVIDKYNIKLANYAFQPQYTLNIDQSYQNNEKPTYEVSPTVSLETSMGASFQVTNSNDMQGDQTTILSITQPLLQGFGWVNDISYLNSMDNEKIAKINYRSSITDVVMAVVSDYRSLVSAELNLKIDKKNLEATEKSTKDYELSFKAGRLAKSEFIQQQATLASAKLSYQSQLNSVQTTYQGFLSQLGVSPWSKFSIDQSVPANKVVLPSLETCIQTALKNNPQYQTQLIELEEIKRGVVAAKDQMKWSVNASVQQELDVTDGVSGSPVALNNFQAGDPILMFSVNVPINNIEQQAGLVSAKIAYEEAKAQAEQAKRDLMIQVQREYQAIQYDQQQIPIGEQSVELEKMSLDNVQLKFKYGKATALDVSTIQTSYVESQSSLVSYRISLLNDLMELDNTLGRVLDQWGITLRY